MENQSSSPEVEPAIQSDFQSVVEQSKANIHAETMQPVKKGRGRQKLPRDANGNIIRDGNSGRVVSGGGPGPSMAPGSHPVAPPPDISKSLIAPLKGLSKIPAEKYKIKELVLSDDEAEAIAKSLNELYAQFAPNGQMSPKTAAVCGVVLVCGSIGFSKYQIYQANKPIPTPDEPKPEDLPQGAFRSIPAEEAFRKRQ